jgi:tripartite-type tricarboxylate transporter receptor subunit TctC
MRIARLCTALLAFSLVWAVSAHCEDWPSRNIRVIVPFPPGGSTDVGARLIGNFLAQALHTQFVVENRSGADGNIGMEVVAKSAPDGYTVLVTTDAVASNVHVFRINFDPLKAFAPVIQISRQPVVLAVHPSLGVGTLDEFLALARREPGLRIASSGLGSQQQIVAEWFAKLAGISIAHVPYRGGAPAITDLVAGHVKVASLGSTPLIPHYKAGAIKLLAQSTATRSPHQRPRARPVARRVRAGRHASADHRAAQRRDQQGAGGAVDPRQSAEIGAGAGRRPGCAVRQAFSRRLREICAAGEGAQHPRQLMRSMSYRRVLHENRKPARCRERDLDRQCRDHRGARP